VKNYPAKNHPGEKISVSGKFYFEREILRRRIIRAKNYPAKNHPSEELTGEESSGEEFSKRRNILTKN
jgi:hypothetical protein